MAAPGAVVLFGAGSPLLVDYEESCAAAGVAIRAIVRNRPVPSHALAADRVVDMAEAGPELFDAGFLIPIFTPGYRRLALDELTAFLAAAGRAPRPATLVDPTARVPASTRIGAGSYVNAGSTIGAAAAIGDWCIVNRGCSIGHHATIEAFVSVGPGAACAGMIRIGRGVVLGVGAVVLPEISIGANAVVAGGAVVTRDVPEGCLVAGNPAQVVRRGLEGYKGVGVP